MIKITMQYLSYLIVFLFAMINIAHASDITVSPNKIGGGEIPSGYDKVTFYMVDGNWTRNIILPTTPSHGSTVTINSWAPYPAKLKADNLNVFLQELTIVSGDSYTFTYNVYSNTWRLSGDNVSYLSPNPTGAVIPDNPTKLSLYSIYNGNWTPEVTLPGQASNGDIMVVRSDATWGSKIAATHQTYASTTRLQAGDYYIFQYSAHLGSWLLEHAPERMLAVKNIDSDVFSPATPRTRVFFGNGNWVPTFNLPATAGDRDRIVVQSRATWSATIAGDNINNFDALRLHTGDEYEFMFIAENKQWEATHRPASVYQARDIAYGRMPPLKRDVTVVEFANGNWVRDLYLPFPSPPNYRVIVKSSAFYPVNVRGLQNLDLNVTPVSRGQTVSFIVDEKGLWQQETIVIDMLLVYSNKVSEAIGEAAARARMYESFSLTNEALENSGANFRLRLAGLREIQAAEHWTKLGDPLSELRSDLTVQGLRNELKADGIYYLGTEAGCGFAYIRSSAYNMIGAGSINCGTRVMRHEFGHNMGLRHGVLSNTSGNYALGYSLVRTIMGGNAIPYFSTPKRFSDAHGIPMGIEGQIDAVRAMNEFSSEVSSYR